uniref:Phostensin/Taperin PP1-binding domain-containing protein n=1 Tax=Esox lucius TaxID=8010 RepID=A0A3P8XP56_ESOLU
MSVSSLPEWKQLLLERKRREEEEREKREKEEEAKLASMPAWKRGIIQRRRKKLDNATGQVLLETITPVHQNPFIRTHGGWRRGREAEKAGETGHEKGNDQEIELGREREKEKEKGHVKGYDGESGRGRDIEIRIERYRDRSAGREMSQDAVRDQERECPRGKKEEEREEGDLDPPSPKYPHPQVPGLRTIRADNIIIIEQDRKGSDERRGRRRESEKEMMDDDLHSEDEDQSCDGEGGKDVERRDSWRMGKPLSRIESLREKIRQREEKPRNMEGASGDEEDAPEGMDKARRASSSDKCEEGEQGSQMETPQPKLAQSNQPASITINSRPLLTPSPENALHPDRGVPPVPSSSPCSPTPPQSASPSSSPSPTLFTIRSASGGKQVKRGTTITITPRKPVGGPPAKTSAQAQLPVLTEVAETGKKRYPTAEEIEVIGGYQNLHKSCLVKSPKGTRKGVSPDCRSAYFSLYTTMYQWCIISYLSDHRFHPLRLGLI